MSLHEVCDRAVTSGRFPWQDGGGGDDGAAAAAAAAGASEDADDGLLDHGYGEKLDQDLLRKYLIYARTHCRPQVRELRIHRNTYEICVAVDTVL